LLVELYHVIILAPLATTSAPNPRSHAAVTWDGALVVQPTLAAALAAVRAGKCTWIDLCGRDPDTERLLGKEGLNLHPLVIEDIFADRERPKVEDFGDYLYVLVQAPLSMPTQEAPKSTRTRTRTTHAEHGSHADRASFRLTELDVVLGQHFVLTHHANDMPSLAQLQQDVQRNARALEQGPAYIAHAVLDSVVDDYIPILDRLDVQLDELEDEVLTNPTQDVLSKIFQSKRELQQLRRAFVHQKELFHRLGRGDFALIPEPLVPFFRDIYDHFARVADLAESYRDLVGAALETYLSVQSNKMNAIMKQLTLTATIFMPLSFIAGFYGMNYEFMPELHQKWGYPAVVALMLLVATGMLMFYRRKKWI
jgi:magnesium transporter